MKKAYLLPIEDGLVYRLQDKSGVLYSLKGCKDMHRIKHAIANDRCIRVMLKDGSLFYGSSQKHLYDGKNGGSVKASFTELIDTQITYTNADTSVNVTNELQTDTADPPKEKVTPIPPEDAVIIKATVDSVKLIPKDLIISDTNWKYLYQSVLLGKNILMTGETGCGKTLAVRKVAETFKDRPFFYFNMGSTQDPKSYLLGNTHYDSTEGTHFVESLFIKAIKTPKAIILLDELTRIHIEGSNILMTVLDDLQRYVMIDDKKADSIIEVADGVTFIATANRGVRYTGVSIMDAAFKDRFNTIIEMPALNKKEEARLLKIKCPIVDEKKINIVTEIAEAIRQNASLEDAKLQSALSTRKVEDIITIMRYGFTLQEAAEVAIYPQFSNDGGADSERTYIKQIVQKYNDGTNDVLFGGVNSDLQNQEPV